MFFSPLDDLFIRGWHQLFIKRLSPLLTETLYVLAGSTKRKMEQVVKAVKAGGVSHSSHSFLSCSVVHVFTCIFCWMQTPASSSGSRLKLNPKIFTMLKTYLNRNSMNICFFLGGEGVNWVESVNECQNTKWLVITQQQQRLVSHSLSPASLRSEDYPLQELQAVPHQQASWSEQL